MVELVGILRPAGRGGTVFPEGKTEYGEVYIPPDRLNGAPYGMKVVVTVDVSPETVDPNGTIKEVLGDPERPDVAIQGIIRMHGLHQTFPKEVSQEAERVPSELAQTEIDQQLARGRRDLRSLKTLTIDGKDAKDLDDAISVKRTDDGGYTLWVHIADVAEYVRQGSAIDDEAFERGNSVYLVDRVLPMLPPQLSNGMCSLNPNADRLALTCELHYDADGRVQSGDVYESLIHSDLRANYEDVFASLEQQAPIDEYQSMWDELVIMQELADKLHAHRVEDGSLEFEFPETKVELDEEGTPTDIYAYPINEANGIIEEFMIAANIFVAKHFTEKKLPLVYRVHELPDPDKLSHFIMLANIQGRTLRMPESPDQKAIADALAEVQKLPAGQTLSQLLLRAMAKARYSEEPLGHFGLGLEDYCHFTSPIRRYPDLHVHRVIKQYLAGTLNKGKAHADAVKVSEHASNTERAAMYAEYDTIDLKSAEYMKQFLGETYPARISGFNRAGMFVQLENTVEGMVPYRTMQEYYFYDERTLTAQAERSGRLFKIGDEINVIVARADTTRRQVDFHMANETESGLVVNQLRETYGDQLDQIPTRDPSEIKRKVKHSKHQEDPRPGRSDKKSSRKRNEKRDKKSGRDKQRDKGKKSKKKKP